MNKDIVKKVDSTSNLPTFGRFNDLFKDLWDMVDTFARDTRMSMSVFDEIQPRGSFPKVNVIDNEDSYDVEIAVAGFDKEDINLELQDNTLFIKADKERCNENDCRNYLRREIASRSFRRVIRFPAEINTNEISAKYENGIISCKIGKVISEKPDSVKIEISE